VPSRSSSPSASPRWRCSRCRCSANFYVYDSIGPVAFGSALLPLALALMLSGRGPGLATVLIGISYSLVPAVMWPLVSRIVERGRFGTTLVSVRPTVPSSALLRAAAP
jgi:hypothetical protein